MMEMLLHLPSGLAGLASDALWFGARREETGAGFSCSLKWPVTHGGAGDLYFQVWATAEDGAMSFLESEWGSLGDRQRSSASTS